MYRDLRIAKHFQEIAMHKTRYLAKITMQQFFFKATRRRVSQSHHLN